ncbi:HalOD1 output domain-containing protein [Haloterrigena salifodinae]|uniref:HalOD1 output domain-containing protein n=1 Tax=Haloterrigena salifodinae TaxID=2675099 RepID=UPI000F89D3AB|nr:HalOD1 output domain-containing protein [Haloterrigena salifodinae]
MNTLINADDSSTAVTSAITANWDADTENTPVYAVASAVAEAEGVDPVDLPPLYETIDPEALNDLLSSRDDSTVATVEFEYAGYAVTVSGEGMVTVCSDSP